MLSHITAEKQSNVANKSKDRQTISDLLEQIVELKAQERKMRLAWKHKVTLTDQHDQLVKDLRDLEIARLKDMIQA